jgi:hypothetical protein
MKSVLKKAATAAMRAGIPAFNHARASTMSNRKGLASSTIASAKSSSGRQQMKAYALNHTKKIIAAKAGGAVGANPHVVMVRRGIGSAMSYAGKAANKLRQ